MHGARHIYDIGFMSKYFVLDGHEMLSASQTEAGIFAAAR